MSARGISDFASGALRGTVELSGEATRALPRLARLGQIQPHTQISLSRLLAEQGRKAPGGECFLFDNRVHTNAAVNQRIDNVVRGLIQAGVRPAAHVGVVMQTRPSALVAIAALSRLGAVAVLLPPGREVHTAIRIDGVERIVTDPENLDAAIATGMQVLVLGGGDQRDLDVDPSANVVDLEKIDPAAVTLPGLVPARIPVWLVNWHSSSAVGPTAIGRRNRSPITGGRCRRSERPSAADLDRGDTVYCLAPLHHSSSLLVSDRWCRGRWLPDRALTRSRSRAVRRGSPPLRGDRGELHVDDDARNPRRREPRARRQSPRPALHRIRNAAGVVASHHGAVRTGEGPRVLRVHRGRRGSRECRRREGRGKGRPLPGSAEVRLAAYDPIAGRLLEDEQGFIRECQDDEVGLLLGRAGVHAEMSGGAMRGIFAAGDAWIPTENLFRRDADGDYWLVDHRKTVIATPRGAVFTQPIVDALVSVDRVDLAVAYGVEVGGRTLAVAAFTLREGRAPRLAEISDAFEVLPPALRPDIIQVVEDIPLGSSYRPNAEALSAAGLPKPGTRVWYVDPESQQYKRLTKAVAAEFQNGSAGVPAGAR